MRDEIDIFIDSTIAWSEHRQALVLAVDKHQFKRSLRDLMARARAGETFETTGDESNDSV
jgi:hypothetical protein